MRLAIALCFVLVLAVSAATVGAYTLVDKIPAPKWPVTGLTSNGYELMVVCNVDTASFTYLLDPVSGEVYDSEWWPFPHQLEAGTFSHDYMYWVADQASGMFYEFEWVDGALYVIDSTSTDRIISPEGLLFQDGGESIDLLYVTDTEEDSLYIMAVNGVVYNAYDLHDVAFMYNLGASSLADDSNNLFMTSYTYPDSLFETTGEAARVGAYRLEGYGEMTPRASTFHNGLLYVAGDTDSIFIFSTGSYSETVPTGQNVIVPVVPEGLTIGFDSVSTAGSLYVQVEEMQPCPPPGGVTFFSEYYDVSTTAQFEYITHLQLQTNEPLPGGVDPRKVRVFVRPSGACTFWRDITVAYTEIVPPEGPEPFRVNTRTLSEDDQFSMFVLGEDRRNAKAVVSLKFGYLRDVITANADTIPEDTYNDIIAKLGQAEWAFDHRRYKLAAWRVNLIADVVRADTDIPHTYDPMTQGANVAGAIIGRAHTLAFSLRSLIYETAFGEPPTLSWKTPPKNILGEAEHSLTLSPNPSRSSFRISLSGTAKHPVSVSVYSVEGALVRRLLDQATLSGGTTLTWDGRNEQGMPVAAGTYFVVVKEGEATTTKKVILQR